MTKRLFSMAEGQSIHRTNRSPLIRWSYSSGSCTSLSLEYIDISDDKISLHWPTWVAKLTYFILLFPLQSWFCFFQLSLSRGTTRHLLLRVYHQSFWLCCAMIQIKKKKSLSKRFNLKYSPNLRQVHRVPSRAQESMQRDCVKASWDGYSLTDNALAYCCQGKGKETPPKKILPTFYPFFLFILWKRKDIPIPIYQQIPQHCTRGRGDTDLLQ